MRQLDLGVAVDMDHSTISRLEAGQHAPRRSEVGRLAVALGLSDGERTCLQAAYERDLLNRSELISDVLLSTDDCLHLATSEVEAVRELRLGGSPQIGSTTAARAAGWLRLVARRASNDRAQSALLAALVDLLVEQTKSLLDFILPEEVPGLLAGPIHEQRRIAEYLHDPRLLQLHAMNRQGALYLVGRQEEAYALSREILSAGILDRAWEPELLRAAAIGAGYIDDPDGIRDIAARIERFVGTAEKVDDTEVAFILEGLARGKGAVRDPTTFDTLERAWAGIERGRTVGGFSSFRSVQLIRTHLKATLALRSRLTIQDERLAADGLAACATFQYGRHRLEIERLLDSAPT